MLGTYSSAEGEIINRQIDWATGHGVDFFAASWWGRDSFEDRVIRESLPRAALANDIRFAILYESAGLLQVSQGAIDVDLAENREKLIADVRYLAQVHMSQPNYLRVEGRPVLFLYLTRIYSGDLEQALQEVRDTVREVTGDPAFVIGDEVYWHSPTQARLAWFDGVTAYNMHTSVPNIAAGFAGDVVRQYRWWAKATERAGVVFVPGVLPGFDDRAVRPEAQHPPIPRSPTLFFEQLGPALKLAHEQVPMVMVTSWNEWHEDTSIEPAEEFGLAYLETLRAALAAGERASP